MEFVQLEANDRGTGKSAARKARRQGEVPCVIYGHGIEPQAFQTPLKGLDKLIRQHTTHLVRLALAGKEWDCILKDVDYHPVSDQPIHADFQVLQEGEDIKITVPFKFVGIPAGQRLGGNTQYVITEASISCLPKYIPASLEVDISKVKIGGSIRVSDLEFEGITFRIPAQQTLVTVTAPRVVEVLDDDEEGEEGAEQGEGEDQGDAGESAE